MKKRICFVDDDPKALKTLEQAMESVNDSWSCTYATNGNAAIKAMAAGPFDAVVAKMRLPGMSGAKLLQEVGKLHPRTVRFILGDVVDQELIVNCIGGTHQFISGLCNPQDLILTIQRSLSLDAWLSTDQLRALIPRLGRLPSLPSTYFAVLKQVESPTAGAKSVGDVIGCDPAVTARLLQMVNSAAFAVSQKITDPTSAVSLLGLETVKSLVLCLQVFSPNDQAKQAGLSFDRLWNHSFTVAKIAREITQLETHDARKANDAFTAGLLHDVGRIVMASNLPQEYAAVVAAAREQKKSLHDVEIAQLGASHAQTGAYLLGLWGMPTPLIEAAALHHTPCHTFTKEFSLLTAVHVANVFAHERAADTDGLPLPALDLAHLTTLGLADKPDAWRRAIVAEKSASEASTTTATGTTSTTAFIRPDNSALMKTKAMSPPQSTVAKASAPAHPAQQHLHWPRWALASGAAVVFLAALLLWMNRSDSNAEIQAQARREAAKPAAANTHAAPATGNQNVAMPRLVQASPFDSVKIQAIFYTKANPSVVVNGKMYGVGERVNGLQIVSISQTDVVLAFGNERKTFRMK